MQAQDAISPVREADFVRVVEVWEASVRATHHFVTEADIQIFKPLVWDGLREVPAEHLLAVRDGEGRVVGFIGVVDDEIAMLFVHPDWRGRGIGRRLLTHAVTTLGATRLDVNEQNDQALGFYRRMDFTVVGRSERDYTGKPYPLLHMRLIPNQRVKLENRSGPSGRDLPRPFTGYPNDCP
ncbi:MAG TPA: GNAT family N-acetyltransferase [Ktedonobacterales bacterium]